VIMCIYNHPYFRHAQSVHRAKSCCAPTSAVQATQQDFSLNHVYTLSYTRTHTENLKFCRYAVLMKKPIYTVQDNMFQAVALLQYIHGLCAQLD
jgi:hypothetical protein